MLSSALWDRRAWQGTRVCQDEVQWRQKLAAPWGMYHASTAEIAGGKWLLCKLQGTKREKWTGRDSRVEEGGNKNGEQGSELWELRNDTYYASVRILVLSELDANAMVFGIQ